VPGSGGDGGNGNGGAIANNGTLTIVTCTLSSNGAFGGTNGVAGSGNFSASNGQPGAANGGNLANFGGPVSILGTILTSSPSGNNASGALSDLGYNLSSDFTASFGSSSLQNTDPKLAMLASNGGPTQTMALLSDSPAIDRIPAELTPPTDQRGFPRPVAGGGDIGAFERGAAAQADHVTLTTTRSPNGTIQLTGQGTTGLSYVIQASTNLIDWQTISTNLAPITFTDSVTNLATRFYRLTR